MLIEDMKKWQLFIVGFSFVLTGVYGAVVTYRHSFYYIRETSTFYYDPIGCFLLIMSAVVVCLGAPFINKAL